MFTTKDLLDVKHNQDDDKVDNLEITFKTPEEGFELLDIEIEKLKICDTSLNYLKEANNSEDRVDYINNLKLAAEAINPLLEEDITELVPGLENSDNIVIRTFTKVYETLKDFILRIYEFIKKSIIYIFKELYSFFFKTAEDKRKDIEKIETEFNKAFYKAKDEMGTKFNVYEELSEPIRDKYLEVYNKYTIQKCLKSDDEFTIKIDYTNLLNLSMLSYNNIDIYVINLFENYNTLFLLNRYIINVLSDYTKTKLTTEQFYRRAGQVLTGVRDFYMAITGKEYNINNLHFFQRTVYGDIAPLVDIQTTHNKIKQFVDLKKLSKYMSKEDFKEFTDNRVILTAVAPNKISGIYKHNKELDTSNFITDMPFGTDDQYYQFNTAFTMLKAASILVDYLGDYLSIEYKDYNLIKTNDYTKDNINWDVKDYLSNVVEFVSIKQGSTFIQELQMKQFTLNKRMKNYQKDLPDFKALTKTADGIYKISKRKTKKILFIKNKIDHKPIMREIILNCSKFNSKYSKLLNIRNKIIGNNVKGSVSIITMIEDISKLQIGDYETFNLKLKKQEELNKKVEENIENNIDD